MPCLAYMTFVAASVLCVTVVNDLRCDTPAGDGDLVEIYIRGKLHVGDCTFKISRRPVRSGRVRKLGDNDAAGSLSQKRSESEQGQRRDLHLADASADRPDGWRRRASANIGCQ